MSQSHIADLELNIARARIFLSLTTLVSVFLDPNVPDMTPWIRLTGGPLRIDRMALGALAAHLAYSAVLHSAASYGPLGIRLRRGSMILDIAFAAIVAVFTEGRTSPAFVFFAFPMIATGCRGGFRSTLAVTLSGAVIYFGLIVFSAPWTAPSEYLMRPVNLAIVGYLLAFLGDQRKKFELSVRELEARDERLTIARSLHDGFIQSLAAVKLRLASCQRWLAEGQVDRGIADLGELQAGVAHEYDEVRAFVRSLAEVEGNSASAASSTATAFDVDVRFRGDATTTENVLLILVEAMRNVVRHAGAATARFRIQSTAESLRISLADDGAGLPPSGAAPWSIASRVREAGGRLEICQPPDGGVQFEIELPNRGDA